MFTSVQNEEESKLSEQNGNPDNLVGATKELSETPDSIDLTQDDTPTDKNTESKSQSTKDDKAPNEDVKVVSEQNIYKAGPYCGFGITRFSLVVETKDPADPNLTSAYLESPLKSKGTKSIAKYFDKGI